MSAKLIVHVADPSHRILKRRVAWLIGQWVYSDEECAKLPLVWQILLHLLSERGESSDMAVNLTAAVAIKECVDVSAQSVTFADLSFGSSTSPTSSLTSSRPCRRCELGFERVELTIRIKLIGEASTLDGKRYVNDAIGVVIERVQGKIMPYLPTLAQSIPGLCELIVKRQLTI